jgi:heme exporter protein B
MSSDRIHLEEEKSQSAVPPLQAERGERRRPLTPYLKAVSAIVWKDLRAEVRSREMINSMVLFTLMTVMVFSLALELDKEARENTIAGILWVTVVFAGILGLSRSLAAEKDRGSLDALLLAPIDRSALFFGKMIGNLLFVLVVALVLIFLMTVLFNISLFKPMLLLIVFLGSLGFTAAGTLLASMSVHARAREAMLPIILMPVVLPVLLSAVRASNAILNEMSQADWLPWIRLLVVADVIFVAAGYALFEYVVEE